MTEVTNCKNTSDCIGYVVQSKTGRDRKRLFLVVSVENDGVRGLAYIADGHLHKMENLKKKNLKHLLFVSPPTGEMLTAISDNSLTNEMIWKYVGRFDPMRECKNPKMFPEGGEDLAKG